MTRPIPVAKELRDAFQSGNDDRMLALLYGSVEGEGPGALMVLDTLLQNASERAITYAVPQIASLIERLAYVDGKG